MSGYLFPTYQKHMEAVDALRSRPKCHWHAVATVDATLWDLGTTIKHSYIGDMRRNLYPSVLGSLQDLSAACLAGYWSPHFAENGVTFGLGLVAWGCILAACIPVVFARFWSVLGPRDPNSGLQMPIRLRLQAAGVYHALGDGTVLSGMGGLTFLRRCQRPAGWKSGSVKLS